MMKNAFYFILKALNICFDFCSCREKSLIRKVKVDVKVDFEIYDVRPWLTNNYSKHITKYLTK